jgi:Ferredoxin-dependent bilin reductase
MSEIFEKTIACAEAITKCFTESGALESTTRLDNPKLKDVVYKSLRYRRAHICTVDARETKKLYLMHCTIMPHFNDNSPIYGFDLVAGPTKVSGAFLDFSSAGDPSHSMMKWFASRTNGLEWNKPRALPEWAQAIFSPSFVAIGAVGAEELDACIQVGLDTLKYYLENVGKSQQDLADFHMAQNRYCQYQKMNPRTPSSLQHLGFTEQEATDFVAKSLFPEIV